MQKLAQLCVHRPVFATMVVAAITVIGAVSLFTLGVDRYPAVEMPVVSVNTSNPGATPESIETEVTERIEAAVKPELPESISTSFQGTAQAFQSSLKGIGLLLIRVTAAACRKEQREQQHRICID